jgi:alpha-methylacyl-CoA racemase
MVLADLGAQGLRIENPDGGHALGTLRHDITRRGREVRQIDLRSTSGQGALLELVGDADVLIEGFRPGVLERRGLGPNVLLERNPALVVGRMTGWGQRGPLASSAGHDLTYLAVAGVLAHIGRRGSPPTPPQNLVADYGGGAMLLLVGVLAALWEAQRTGRGQVVDAAMVDGCALLSAFVRGLHASGAWSLEAGVNLLDSGAPFYDVYRTQDDRWLAVAPLEPRFFAEFVELTGLDQSWCAVQYDQTAWPALREAIGAAIATRSRDDWAEVFEGTDACAAPVLTMIEATRHPHLVARGTFVTIDGIEQPAPAPRFLRPDITVDEAT